MNLPKNYTKITKQKNDLLSEIDDAITKVIKQHNYEIEYSVINSVLTEVLKDNLNQEIKQIMER